jgi:hypothetical protein
MANSYLLYTGNGSTTQYSLAGIDGWISTGFLKVYFNDNSVPEATSGYTFIDLSTAPKIQFTVAPPNNTVIRIQRETPSLVSTFRSNVVDFEDTSILTADDLDKALQGALHIVQEANDTGSGALPPTADGTQWNAEAKRITNTANPINPNDATTKAYVDGVTLYGAAIAVPQSWTFSGDSTTVDFTLSPAAATTDPEMFIVEVGGTIQQPTTDYTVTASTLSFVSAPATGVDNIVVRNLGVSRNVMAFADNVTFAQNVTVTGSTTSGSFVGPVTGNASTATALQTARTINGTSFDGTANISVTADTATIANDAVTDAKLRNSAALSVIGRAANSSGDPGDIVAATDGHVFRRSGTALGFGQIANAAIPANTIGLDKLVNMAAAGFLGRTGAGAVTELSAANAKTVLGYGNMADETKTNYVSHTTNQVGAINLIRGTLSGTGAGTNYTGGSITNAAGLISPVANFSAISFQSLTGAFEIGASRLRPTSATGGTWAIIAAAGESAQFMAIAIRTA